MEDNWFDCSQEGLCAEVSRDEQSYILCKENLLLRAAKHCSVDPIPANVLISCFDTLLPVITKIVNTSLRCGKVPDCLKSAVILPGLKNRIQRRNILAAFALFPTLNLLPRQSRKLSLCRPTNIYQTTTQGSYTNLFICLTESALVKVHDDILMALDNQNSVIILLLDLSAAFDTVDHNILLSRLKSRFGINGIVLDWFRSYLPNRTYTVTVLGGRSTY